MYKPQRKLSDNYRYLLDRLVGLESELFVKHRHLYNEYEKEIRSFFTDTPKDEKEESFMILKMTILTILLQGLILHEKYSTHIDKMNTRMQSFYERHL